MFIELSTENVNSEISSVIVVTMEIYINKTVFAKYIEEISKHIFRQN